MTKRIAAVLVLAAGLGAATAAPHVASAADDASHPPAICPRLDGFVQLEFGEWDGPLSSSPRERFALAGSEGANRPGGLMMFGFATAARATSDRACRLTRVRPNPSLARLSQPFVYRRTGTGNAYFTGRGGTVLAGERLRPPGHSEAFAQRNPWGVRFRCAVGARVTVLMVDSRDRAGRVVGTYFSARVGREMLATATLRTRGESFFRISRRCDRG
jgi:hypothetical protein